MSVKKHRHEFSGLWWNLGIYGPTNVHVHSCVDDDCDRVVVGPSRDCDGDKATHHRETLGTSDPMAWFASAQESDADIGPMPGTSRRRLKQ